MAETTSDLSRTLLRRRPEVTPQGPGSPKTDRALLAHYDPRAEPLGELTIEVAYNTRPHCVKRRRRSARGRRRCTRPSALFQEDLETLELPERRHYGLRRSSWEPPLLERLRSAPAPAHAFRCPLRLRESLGAI